MEKSIFIYSLHEQRGVDFFVLVARLHALALNAAGLKDIHKYKRGMSPNEIYLRDSICEWTQKVQKEGPNRDLNPGPVTFGTCFCKWV